MGGSSTTTTNTAQNQNQNSASNYAQNGVSQTQQNSATNYAQNSATTGAFNQNSVGAYSSQNQANSTYGSTTGPVAAAMKIINDNYGPISQDKINNYLNPYQTDVINATMAQQAHTNAEQQQGLKGNAISQGALGGDRAKIAEAELMRGQGLNDASVISGLRSNNYTQALSAAQADRAAALQAAGMMGTDTSGTSATSGTSQGVSAQQSQGTSASNTATTGSSQSVANALTQSSVRGSQSSASSGAGTGASNSTTEQGMGIGSMAGMGLMALSMFSDKRVKEDIEPVGKSFDGQTIYKYRYKGDPKTQIGFIAQDVERHHPEAVGSVNGVKTVNYDSATKEAAHKGHFADGGEISGLPGRDQGGQVMYAPKGFGEMPTFTMPVMTVQPAPAQGDGVSQGMKQAQDAQKMYQLGQKARVGLGNLIDKINPQDDSSTQAVDDQARATEAAQAAEAEKASQAAEAAQTSEAGGLAGDAAAAGKGSGGAVQGLSRGGHAGSRGQQTTAPAASTPVASSQSSTGLPGLGNLSLPTMPTMSATPAVAAPATPSMPTVAAPTVSMPSYNPNGLSVSSPSVSFPSVPQAYAPPSYAQSSGGKGSGGAVREFSAGGGLPRYDDGGSLDDLAFLEKSIADQKLTRDEAPASNLTPEGNQPMWGKGTLDSPVIGAPGTVIGDIVGAKPVDKGVPQESFSEPSEGNSGLKPGIAEKGWAGLSDWNKAAPKPSWTPSVEGVESRPVSTFRVNPDGSDSLGALAQNPLVPRSDIAPSGASNLVDQSLGAQERSAVQPAPVEAQNLAEPGADQIAPEKPVNHMTAFVDTARKAGMSDNAILGVGWNLRDESGGNPGLVSKGDQRGRFPGEANNSHGMFQFGGDNWTQYEAWRKDNHPDSKWDDAGLQTEFLTEQLKNKQPGTWKRMNEAETPGEAAQIFLHEYEKPAKRYADARHEQYGQSAGTIDDLTASIPTVTNSRSASGKETRTDTSEDGDQGAAIAPKNAGLGALQRKAQPLVDKATDPDVATPKKNAYKDDADAEKGSLLQRLFGVDFNPLGLDKKERAALFQAGATMMATGNVGQGLLAGSQYQQDLLKNDRQSKLDAMKLNMEFAKMTQPVVIGETVDPNTGVTHKQYGSPSYNAETGKMTWPTPSAAQAGAPVSSQTSYLAPEVPVEEALKRAPVTVATMAKKYANYELPPPSAQAMKNPIVAEAVTLAEKVRPGFSAQDYKVQQDIKKSFTSGKDAAEVTSYSAVMHHVASADSAVDALGNYQSSWVNAPMNAVRGQTSDSFIKAKAAAENGIDTAISEYNKATSGKPITVDERQSWRDKLSTNSSPSGMHATYKSFMEYIEGRMSETANKYNGGMKLSPDSKDYKTPDNMLSPSARKEWHRLRGDETPAAGAAQAQPQADAGNSNTVAKQGPAGYTGPTATGAKGEKYIVQNGQWVMQ